ncbi:predicted protein [Nematostella vectensis]|uniref:Apple domain-containing protein n=1 Tax=Nematostella vectensis TaxID=45351 RepID=A7SNB6_NEMVE|nr:predicted protein [Nematostella vectensis]|eukprot:XP_001626905.1 predicted protein [Nematostella vectensis]
MELVAALLLLIQRQILNGGMSHRRAETLYPLNAEHRTRDISGNGLPAGIASGVTLDKGPDGREGGAYYFSGTSSSYIEIPYHAKIDTREYYMESARVRFLFTSCAVSKNERIRLAAVAFDSRSFRGRMACLQIYNEALTLKQIRKSSGLCSEELIRPCINYTPIEDVTRAFNQTWYRLKGQQQISTQGPQSNLGLSGWMRGPHPQREIGAVERDLCFGDVRGSCQHKASVTVRHCFGYYVYKFIGLPQEHLQISVDKDVDAETLPERIFQERPRFQLTDHVFYEESNVPSPAQCVEYCLVAGEKCESLNYSSKDNGTCQLNNATASGYGHHLLANQSWAYFHPIALV